ncbi:MAG: Transcriptional regulator, IclR [Frankiales bacterium]|nr:Transcriptional regulator, IclR [Frankiales bacterium]
MTEPQRDHSSIAAIGKAVRLLDVFSNKRPELTVAELVELTGFARSTVYRLVGTLEEVGWLFRTEAGAYRPTLRLFRLGNIAANATDIRHVARPFLAAMSKELGDSSYLFVRDGQRAVCLERLEGPYPIKVTLVEVGGSLPLTVGAAPRTLLAYDDDSAGGSGVNGSNLPPDLERVREQGYEINLEDVTIGFCSVGAPVLNRDGGAVAAVSLGGIRERFSPERLPTLVEAVVRTAQQISGALGYGPAAAPVDRRS